MPKTEENEALTIEWPMGHVHLGTISEAIALLQGSAGCVGVGAKVSAYLAFHEPPDQWMSLFHLTDHHPTHADLTYRERPGDGVELTTVFTVTPCEMGEHLHAVVTVAVDFNAEEGQNFSGEDAVAKIGAAWRLAAARLEELKVTWIDPCLESALDFDSLHA